MGREGEGRGGKGRGGEKREGEGRGERGRREEGGGREERRMSLVVRQGSLNDCDYLHSLIGSVRVFHPPPSERYLY